MVSGRVLPSSPKRPCTRDGRFPLDATNDLSHGVLRGQSEEHVPVVCHHVPLFTTTCLVLGSRAQDCPKMPPQLVIERFPTLLRDTHPMLRAVPLGRAESLAVWPDKLPLGGTLSGAPEGVCCCDSWNGQTVGVPRQSRGFTSIKLLRLRVEHMESLQCICIEVVCRTNTETSTIHGEFTDLPEAVAYLRKLADEIEKLHTAEGVRGCSYRGMGLNPIMFPGLYGNYERLL
jgi:hypothetical protein